MHAKNGWAVLLKFRYCEKTTKLEKISHLIFELPSKVKTKWEIFSNFCGLLRISELYIENIVLKYKRNCC